jgi:hypothetical protein
LEPVCVTIEPSSDTSPWRTTGSSEPVNASRGIETRIDTPCPGSASVALNWADAPGLAEQRSTAPCSP